MSHCWMSKWAGCTCVLRVFLHSGPRLGEVTCSNPGVQAAAVPLGSLTDGSGRLLLCLFLLTGRLLSGPCHVPASVCHTGYGLLTDDSQTQCRPSSADIPHTCSQEEPVLSHAAFRKVPGCRVSWRLSQSCASGNLW